MRYAGFHFIAVLMVLASAPSMAQTAITYQGQLQDANGPVNSTVEMDFVLYDDEAGNNQLASDGPYTVDIVDGLFQVELDFGAVYSSPPDYLEIKVDGTALAELQKLTPSPAAISVPWSGVTGAPGFWRLGGNAGTNPGTDYLGTTDATTFALRVNDREVLRMTPSEDGTFGFSPNLIAGYPRNDVDESTDNDPPVVGAVVGGGGWSGSPNRVGEDFATIGGGSKNTASGPHSTVGGGFDNAATDLYATVSGGARNDAIWPNATVGGGSDNTASNSASTVGGGTRNTANGRYATVPGGRSNKASGDYSLAAGLGATAGHDGVWVWSDSTSSGSFVSSGANQFLIEAAGGIGLNTNAPDAPLHLAGENNWNLTSTEGDFKIGNDSHRFKLGVSLDGAGAGNVRLRAQGGTNNLILGSNETDVVNVNDTDGLDPMTDDTFSLGSSDARWTAVWAADGTINTSDARLKRDIASLDDGLETVRALRPVTYRWKSGSDDMPRPGLIAQEVRRVVPEIVVEPTDEKGTLGIRYSELIPVLISALQEQDQATSERFNQLAAENAELEDRLIALEAENTHLRELAKRNSEIADRNTELEKRLAALESMLLEVRRVAEGH